MAICNILVTIVVTNIPLAFILNFNDIKKEENAMFASRKMQCPTSFVDLGTSTLSEMSLQGSADDADDMDLARRVKQANLSRQINTILKDIESSLENPTGDPTVKYKGHVLKETVDFLNQRGFRVTYQAYDRYNNTQWALIYPDDDKVYLGDEALGDSTMPA